MNIETVIGSLAGICTTIAFIPQVIMVVKTKQTKDLSLAMYSILTFGVCLWLMYGILVVDIPVMVANGITFILALIVLVSKIKYG